MKMKALACCRRRPQDLSIDMDQEPDSKQSSLPPCQRPTMLDLLYRMCTFDCAACVVVAIIAH